MFTTKRQNDNPPVCFHPTMVGSNGVWMGDDTLNYSFPLLALQLFLVIITTKTSYYLLKPLRQPRVISEIIGGIILGPSVLGRNEAFRRTVFPDRGSIILQTVSMFGLMYVIFLIGLKLDPGVIKQTGRKSVYIGLMGMLTQFIVMFSLCLCFRAHFSKDIRNNVFFFFLSFGSAITSFSVLVPVLSDLNLLNSDLGRLGMSASMSNDISAWVIMTLFITMQASLISVTNSLWALLSVMILIGFILCVLRPASMRIIEKTPRGKPVNEFYIFVILMVVSVVGFFSDMIGANSFNGALVVGLAIPNGPPLGSTLVERLDSLASGFLLPLYYASSGLMIDVSTIKDMTSFGVLQIVIIVGVVSKLVGTFVFSVYYKMPSSEALCISLLLCSKGLAEVVTYTFWKNIKLIDDQTFTILILSVVATTAVVTPLMSSLYHPTKRYVLFHRRTVQHSGPDTELRMLTLVHHPSNVPALIDLLSSTYASLSHPLHVTLVHILPLIGRASPLLIHHTSGITHHSAIASEPIINAFRKFQSEHESYVSLLLFTAISPSSTAHEEICRIGQVHNISLLLLPFHKFFTVEGTLEINHNARTINQNILAQAPCSVGILIDRSVPSAGLLHFTRRIAVLFFGGDDDREALSLASRMARHHGVDVNIVRFLPDSKKWEDTRERRIDEHLLDEMRLRKLGYREVFVMDPEEVVGEITAVENEGFDLLMVGMRHHRCSMLRDSLSGLSEYPELGVVGDIMVSGDFGSSGAVLVVRQQPQTVTRAVPPESGHW